MNIDDLGVMIYTPFEETSTCCHLFLRWFEGIKSLNKLDVIQKGFAHNLQRFFMAGNIMKIQWLEEAMYLQIKKFFSSQTVASPEGRFVPLPGANALYYMTIPTIPKTS